METQDRCARIDRLESVVQDLGLSSKRTSEDNQVENQCNKNRLSRLDRVPQDLEAVRNAVLKLQEEGVGAVGQQKKLLNRIQMLEDESGLRQSTLESDLKGKVSNLAAKCEQVEADVRTLQRTLRMARQDGDGDGRLRPA